MVELGAQEKEEMDLREMLEALPLSFRAQNITNYLHHH